MLHLISSFLHTRSLLVPCAYVSIESIDCISSFESKATLLISSVKTLHFSILNFCYVFNISLLFLMNSFLSSLRLSVSSCFLPNGLFYFQFKLLLNSFYNLEV